MHGLERGHHPRCLGNRQPDQRCEARSAIQGYDGALRIPPQQCRSARNRTRHRPRSWNAVGRRTGHEVEEPDVPARGRHADAGARDRRHARGVLREHFPAGGDGLARRPAGDHDMVVRAAVPAALSRSRTADGADGRRRLADRNRWRGHGADGPDACGRRPVRRTKPGESLRQLSPARWAALPGAIHGDHLSGEPGPQDCQGRKMGARQHRARLCDRGARRSRRAGATDICPARLGDLRRFTDSVRATDQAGDRAIAA